LTKPTAINRAIVKIEKRFNDEIKTESGITLYKDTSFKPEENSTIEGVVVSAPDSINGVSDGFCWDVKEGDKLYFHYGVTIDESNSFTENGETFWNIEPYNAIARVRDGRLKPVGHYILVRPSEKKKPESSILFIPDSAAKEDNTGTVVASNDDEMPEGSVVVFEERGKFWNFIEGEKLYCMNNSNVMYVIN